jgi:hypothetical protein
MNTWYYIAILLALLIVIIMVDINQRERFYNSGADIRQLSLEENKDQSRDIFDKKQSEFYSRYTTFHN